MKKYLILGNPLSHSLSPKLHNYWIKQNNLEGVYEAKETNEESIKEVISDIKKGEIEGMNVTVPFKRKVIPYLDELSDLANRVGKYFLLRMSQAVQKTTLPSLSKTVAPVMLVLISKPKIIYTLYYMSNFNLNV